MRLTILLLSILLVAASGFSQAPSIIEGYIYDARDKTPLSFAMVKVVDSEQGSIADSTGFFQLTLQPGLYNLEISAVGYLSEIKREIQTSSAIPVYLEVDLDEQVYDLKIVEVNALVFDRSAESPLALQRISSNEIERMPGATLDVSRFIKTLPGVAPRTSFGYNLIVRGGASNENRFYLDGVEIPTITHFTVQGTSGGPNGMVNVRMLRQAELHAGAFPAGKGNALSSVLELHQRDGRKDRFGGNFTLGATDWGFFLEGPIGKKSSFIFSARESFSQHMFKAIGLPVLPTYSDVQFKNRIKFNPKNELILTGIGAYDKYELNLEAESTESLLYNTGYIPEGKQVVYAAGAVYKHYLPNSVYSVVLSRNFFFNQAEKYLGNSYDPKDQTLDYRSKEGENKLRIEHKIYAGDLEINYGVNGEFDQLSTENFSLFTYRNGSTDTLNYQSDLNLFRYGAFGSVAYKLAGGRISLFGGLRLDGNSYNGFMQNPLRQLSPRVSASWQMAENWRLNGHAGIYYQLPSYILMLYRENGELVNREELKYQRSQQLGLGVEHATRAGYQVKLEGFYKHYDQYPFLLLDSISLANANANYVLIGNQPAISNSVGRAYGLEFQVKQQLKKTYYWSLTYNYIISQFQDVDGTYVASSWDNRHSGTVAAGKTFKGNWTIGLRWSAAGGSPYSPYDIPLSALKSVWEVNQKGLPDYSRLNAARLPWFHQLDIRVDKQWNFRKWTLSVFLDVQNVYSAPIPALPYLTVDRDAENNPITDPTDADRYLTKILSSDTGRVLPSLGVLVDL